MYISFKSPAQLSSGRFSRTPIRRRDDQLDEEVIRWRDLILVNGGELEHDSIMIADRLMKAIKRSTLNDKIVWLLPFLGKGILSGRAPLRAAVSVGLATNNGSLVDSDFSQQFGLKGNGTDQSLSSPYYASQLGTSGNGGLGFWAGALDFTGEVNHPMGAVTLSTNSHGYYLTINAATSEFQWANDTLGAKVTYTATSMPGHYYGQRSSATSRKLYIDGVEVGSNTVNAANTPGTDIIRVLGVETNFAGMLESEHTGQCAYLTNGELTDPEIAELHSILRDYLVHPKQGGSTTEAAIWDAAVRSVSGTFSSTSFRIASNLSSALNNLSCRPKIKYLMPLLGGNIAAATVPLIDEFKVGPATNTNFVDGDFSQSTGLQAGNTKYLNTNLYAAQLGAADLRGGMGVWELNTSRSGDGYALGADSNSALNTETFSIQLYTTSQILYWGKGSDSRWVEVLGAAIGGFYYGQRSSTSLLRLYRDGSTVGSNTSTYTATDLSNRKIILSGMLSTLGTFTSTALKSGCFVLTDGTLTDTESSELYATLVEHLMTTTGRIPQEVSTWMQAVRTAGGGFTTNSVRIATNLMVQLNAASYRSKIKYLAPLLGTGINAARVPLVDDLLAGNLTNVGSSNFVDGDFSEATGLQGNGTSKLFGFNLFADQIGTTSNCGMGYYERNFDETGTTSEVMGGVSTTGFADNRYVLDLRSTQYWFSWGAVTTRFTEAVAAGNGHFYGQRSSSTSRKLYKNGVLKGENTTSDSATNAAEVGIRLMGSETYGLGPSKYYNKGLCGYSYLTDGTMSDADATAFNTLLSTYLITPTGR